MGFMLFMVGGFFGVAGFVLYWLSYKICRQIVDATASEPYGLKHREIWFNILQANKWAKLASIRREGNAELKIAAKKTMRYEILSILFIIAAMILMVIGVTIGV